MNRGRVRPGAGWSLFGAELLLTLLMVSVVITMRRLFDSWDYLPTLVTVALASHLIAAITRRQRWPLGASAVVSAIAMVIVLAVLVYRDSLFVILPSFETWRLAGSDLAAAWSDFSVVKAPTPATDGFLVAAGMAIWTLALAADIAAFRLRTAIEALAPAIIIFVFTSILGIDSHRLVASAAVVACSILFTLLLRIAYPPEPSIPIAATRDRQAGALARVGVGISIAALGVGLVFGPVLPGVDAAPVIDFKELDGGGSGPRVTLSPLVDARGRLVQQSGRELFRVSADQPAYWRISGLDRFNGAVWGSDRTYSEATGRLNDPVDDQDSLTQLFTITGLSSIWMPAAFEPVRFSGDGIIWDDESATLVLQRGQSVEPGTQYRVTSSLAVPTPEELRAASAVVPIDILENYTALPLDFSADIRLLADQLTVDADTTYDKALALQNYFLDNFVYTLDVASGHDGNRMENFLFEDRRGYCEQFAGTFAAMARSIGIPSRVAVGFTPGEFIDGQYVVRGEHYHAWPEVWIDGQWVYFEPTPGRGAPRAQQYTGVPQQQAVPGDPEAAQLDEGSGLIPQLPQEPELGTTSGNPTIGDELALDQQPSSGGTVAPWVTRSLLVLLVLAAIGGLWVFAVPFLNRLRRNRRRDRAGVDTRAAVAASWSDLTESLFLAGHPARPDETHHEFVARVARRGQLDAARLDQIAVAADQARYGDVAPASEVVGTTRTLVNEVERQLETGITWQERIRRRADPRTLASTTSS